MIEQTELVVKEWIYMPPANDEADNEKLHSDISLEVMKKTAATKKGIACRFSCKIIKGNDTILLYIAEDSYVIDLADPVDKAEILTMMRNSYAKFTEKFEFRKMGTVLHEHKLMPLDEANINTDAIMLLLN